MKPGCGSVVRVLVICPYLAPGGAEHQLLLMCRHVDRRRFRLAVAHYDEPGTAIAGELERLGVELVYLDRQRLGVWGLLRELRATIRRQRPDILQCWLRSGCRLGRAAALGIDGLTIVALERTVSHLGAARCLLDRLLNPWTACWVGNAKAVVRHLRDAFHFPHNRMAVIYNGIETRLYQGVEPLAALDKLRAEGHRVVLNLGRLDPVKDQKLFLEVAAEVARHVDDVKFVIAGDGCLREELKADPRALQLGDRCLFLGWQEDVPSVLAGADLLIQTSRFEGLPNVVMEAMCAGLPVVATSAGGTAELLCDGEDGFIVPVGDRRALVDRTLRVLRDPALGGRLGRAACRKVRTYFSAEAMAHAYEELFLDLLEARASRA